VNYRYFPDSQKVWANACHNFQDNKNQDHVPTYPTSLPTRIVQALPVLPALAVLPHRCENALVSVGGSYCTTTSTLGRSRPRAATSVARRMQGEEGSAMEEEKEFSVLVRVDGVRFPCNENSFVWMERT